MTFKKPPQDKMMRPQETKMPNSIKAQRENICEVMGHLFNQAIVTMIKMESESLPSHAICSRCGNKINLSQI